MRVAVCSTEQIGIVSKVLHELCGPPMLLTTGAASDFFSFYFFVYFFLFFFLRDIPRNATDTSRDMCVDMRRA